MRLRVDRRRLKVNHTIEFNNLTLINAAKKINYFNKQNSDYNCERNYFDKKSCFDNLIEAIENAIDYCYINQIARLIIDYHCV